MLQKEWQHIYLTCEYHFGGSCLANTPNCPKWKYPITNWISVIYTVYMCFYIIYIYIKLIIDRSVEFRVCLYHTNKLRLTMRHFMEMNSKYLCATFICSYYNLHWRTRTFSIHMSHSRNAMSQDKHEKAFWKHCEVRGPSVRGHYLNNKDKSTDQAWFSTFSALC